MQIFYKLIPNVYYRKFSQSKDRHELAEAMNEALDNIHYWASDYDFWSGAFAKMYQKSTGYIFVRYTDGGTQWLTSPF